MNVFTYYLTLSLLVATFN